MSDAITWTNEKRKLSELKPWQRNPRQIKADQAARLRESFEEFGQIEPIAIGPNNEVYNGHQRLSVLMAQYGGEHVVEVRVSSRALSEKEREKLTIFLHKGAAGEWDFDTLSEWDVPDLLEWGFKPYELGIPGADSGFNPEDEWEGMPEFERSPLSFRSLHIHFDTQEAVDEFAELIGQEITAKTKSIWHPAKERRELKTLRYEANEP